MVKSGETTTTKMSVRRSSTTANGFVQQRNPKQRRRNAVANIFSELNDGDVRALRQQAQDMLHPTAIGASQPGSSADSSSSEDLSQTTNFSSGTRRRRNALHDIGIGIDHTQLQQLREQALALHHPTAMMTTPPGAPNGGADGVLRRTPRSVSMLVSAAGGVTDNVPDESGAAECPEFSEFAEGPSHYFAIDSITNAVPRSVSTMYGASSHYLSSATSSDAITTITETDGDIFRERISRSSTR